MIDVADAVDAPGAALEGLKKRGIKQLDLVVLTHFHKDHYGRLRDVVKAGIVVKKVALNVPDRASADREIPWGADWADIQALLTDLHDWKIPYFTPKAGDRLIEVKDDQGIASGLDVLCVYDGLNTPVGATDVNDTSIILRLFDGPTRVLFAGDLNAKLGGYLATSDIDFSADVLKAPHHGTEGCAPNIFFDRVGAGVVLVPSPKKLWESDRSKRIREYFSGHKIPAYVSGINGDVTVTLSAKGYSIVAER